MGKCKGIWEGNTKIEFQETGCKDVDLNHLVYVVKSEHVMKLHVS